MNPIALTEKEIERIISIESKKLNTLFSPSDFTTVLFAELYEDIENEELRDIFITLHTAFNNLLGFMYQKYVRGHGGHFNANPSRDLIRAIKTLRVLEAALKNSRFNFKIESSYAAVLDTCHTFLNESGGSTIPTDIPVIDLIEYKPIFTLSDVIAVKRPQGSDKLVLKGIGGGSYADVFKYKDPFYNQWFALKKAKKTLTAKELERFKNEFEETKKFDSPYIIRVYRYDDVNNEYVMEYANGKTLAEYIAVNNTKLIMQERLIFITQLFRAFSYIHSKGRLHRDVSYTNILVQIYEDTKILKISDFGLVKVPESSLTSIDSSLKGSLNDPDLGRVGFNKYEVGHEIYSIAQVINFILTGKKFGNGLYDKSKGVKDFLLRATHPDITHRFSSVTEMAAAFDTVRDEVRRVPSL
ncbi:protein kinase family protein [Paenibacillus antri]|uniref:Protein kinase family protein n=1 Tax=Paenibacillus antri TaxID=2582848 RepID=A0A5R9GFH2_9BACL|nr:protein kinase [Paenibacillus antri]TLS53929.1 protein kinase family protein [Paenibacillus antri]